MRRALKGSALVSGIIGVLPLTCAVPLIYWWATSSPPQSAASPPSSNDETPLMRNPPSAENTPWSQVGPSGGRLTVEHGFAFDASVTVDIPPQAEAPDELRAFPVEISWRPRTGRWLGVAVFVESKRGRTQFSQPLTLTLHLPRADMVGGAFPVGYRWEPETGEIEPIDSGHLDPTAGTAVFTTFRPGIYTWVLVFP